MNSALDTAFDRIDKLNLVTIGHRLRTKEGWSQQRIAQAEREYRRFLVLLALYPSETFVPWTDDLDMFWHCHILDSRKYDTDCRELLGRFVHHDPNVSVDPVKYERDKELTRQRYQQHFAASEKNTSTTNDSAGSQYWWGDSTPTAGSDGSSDRPSCSDLGDSGTTPDGQDGSSSCSSASCSGSSCGGGGCSS